MHMELLMVMINILYIYSKVNVETDPFTKIISFSLQWNLDITSETISDSAECNLRL